MNSFSAQMDLFSQLKHAVVNDNFAGISGKMERKKEIVKKVLREEKWKASKGSLRKKISFHQRFYSLENWEKKLFYSWAKKERERKRERNRK